jgi:transglutaminase-like putative cysteine protease
VAVTGIKNRIDVGHGVGHVQVRISRIALARRLRAASPGNAAIASIGLAAVIEGGDNMQIRQCCRAVTTALAVFPLVIAPVWAGGIEVVGELDLADVLGVTDPGYQIPALTHDGETLWLTSLSGDRLLRVDPEQGGLVESVALTKHDPVEPAALAFGAEYIWMLDAKSRDLLKVARNGKVKKTYHLPYPDSELVALDFQPSSAGRPDRLVVALRERDTGTTRLIGYDVDARSLAPAVEMLAPVEGLAAMATGEIAGEPYTWLCAPREAGRLIMGDMDPSGDWPVDPMEELKVGPPDDSIPRGGHDWNSSHRLILSDPVNAAFVWEAYHEGDSPPDIAASENKFYYPVGTSVIIAALLEEYELEYDACVIRDVKLVNDISRSTPADFYITDAAPWDLSFGPPSIELYREATGSYSNQDVLQLLDISPSTGVRHTEFTFVDGASIARQAITFPFTSETTVDTSYEMRVRVCAAHYDFVPARVHADPRYPEEIVDLYLYEDDGDGYGDDNPGTCVDDYYDLDHFVVHLHMRLAGVTLDMSAYDKARAIHEYVISRHVYSPHDGGWTSPADKLESPYATCSSAAFMVAALAREAGLPARIVGTSRQRRDLSPGDTYRDRMFHRWAQVYLPPYGWVRVDSTPADPGDVGFADVNGDGMYDECDLCTSDSQCSSAYGKSFAGCGISTPFTNVNDADGDGTVSGDDVRAIGLVFGPFANANYYDDRFGLGVSARDLITITAVGVPDNFLEKQYITEEIETIGSECDPVLLSRTLDQRFIEWTNPMLVYAVGVFLLASPASAGDEPPPADAVVTWETEGPFEKTDLVRIDLYERIYEGQDTRFRHVRQLAGDVNALYGEHEVSLGEMPDDGDYVVAVTRQGRVGKREFWRGEQADWETFGLAAVP